MTDGWNAVCTAPKGIFPIPWVEAMLQLFWCITMDDSAGAVENQKANEACKSQCQSIANGTSLEPVAAYWYGAKTGNTVTEDTNLYQHADHPYALANFDRRFTRASDNEPGILECKAVLITKRMSGQMERFRSTMNCS